MWVLHHNGLMWTQCHQKAHTGMLGFLPGFLNVDDERPACEQFKAAYGWRPFDGFKMLPNGNLSYPGDPEVQLLAETKLRYETIRFYDCAWVAIIQPDESFEICRMD